MSEQGEERQLPHDDPPSLEVTTVTIQAGDADELRVALEQRADALDANATWWLHADQADGVVVGRRGKAEGSNFGLASPTPMTSALAPRNVEEIVMFSEGFDVRVYPSDHDGTFEIVTRRTTRRDGTVREVHLALIGASDDKWEPGAEPWLTTIARSDGSTVLVPEPWPSADGHEVVLRMVQHMRVDANGVADVVASCYDGFVAMPVKEVAA